MLLRVLNSRAADLIIRFSLREHLGRRAVITGGSLLAPHGSEGRSFHVVRS